MIIFKEGLERYLSDNIIYSNYNNEDDNINNEENIDYVITEGFDNNGNSTNDRF